MEASSVAADAQVRVSEPSTITAVAYNNRFEWKTLAGGWAAIYITSMVVNYFLNMWMRAAPIGGDKSLFWFDNATLNLLALWWCFVFGACALWPFSLIKGRWTRGIVAILSCWVLGYLTLKGIHAIGGGQYVFPAIGNFFLTVVFIGFTGENFLWPKAPPYRQLFYMVVACLCVNSILVFIALMWLPAWWFTAAQMLLATTLFGYLFRRLAQPAKTVMAWALMIVFATLLIYVSKEVGIWDMKAAGIGNWTLGNYSNDWLLFFMVWCAFLYGVLTPLRNWPFFHVRMPWGGLLGCAFALCVTIAVTYILRAMIGNVFSDIYTAMTYGYMPVSWSFFIPMMLGIGVGSPYLWKGQKTPGVWDDVD